MHIPHSLKHIGDFAGKFTLNALEGAMLTSIVTLGPHVFKKYVYPGFSPLLELSEAIAYTVMGSVGYSAYKTILDPAASSLNKSITDIPKNISKFATNVIFPKTEKAEVGKTSNDKRKVKDAVADIYRARDDTTLRDKKIDDLSSSWFAFRKDSKNKEKASLYSTTLWSLGTLSVFGGIFSLTSKWFESPVIPFLASTTISLGGSYYLNKQAIYYGRKVAEGAKKSDLFKKTCEAVDNLWTFGGTTLKLTILASGIWGANGLKTSLVDPVVNSTITDTASKSAESLWSWTSYVSGGISGAVGAIAYKVSPLYDFMFNSSSECFKDPKKYDQLYEAIRNGTKSVSEMDLPPHTPEECKRIFDNQEFISNYIKPTWDFSVNVTGKISSGIKFGFGLLGSGLYIASGLVFRASTIGRCNEAIFPLPDGVNKTHFNKLNPFLCTNAERIDSVFTNYLNPAGTAVKNGTIAILGGISTIFNKSWSVTMTSANIVSGLLFRESTLKNCATIDGFKNANGFLCTNAGRIESIFANYLNPAGAAIKHNATYVKDGFRSIFTTSWSSAGIIAGLIYREATLDKCVNKDGFKAANEFLCTNAERIDSLFTRYLTPLGNNIVNNAAWVRDNAALYGSIAATAIKDTALNPTVQKSALGIAATGVALYGLHALATKAQEYYASKNILPLHDIEMEIPIAEKIPIAEEIPIAEVIAPDTDKIILNEMPVPSAPPIELMSTTDIDPPLDLPPDNRDFQEQVPVSFLSKMGSMFRSFASEVKVWAYNLYTSLTQIWNNLWTKKPIDKN